MITFGAVKKVKDLITTMWNTIAGRLTGKYWRVNFFRMSDGAFYSMWWTESKKGCEDFVTEKNRAGLYSEYFFWVQTRYFKRVKKENINHGNINKSN